MLLKPIKTKYSKAHRGRLSRILSRFRVLKNGHFGLIAQESGFLTAFQIEASRQVINRTLKRKAQIWINVFPDLPITSKPTEVRMGKGKGGVKGWVCRIKAGMIIFEVNSAFKHRIFEALYAAKKKLPIKTLIYKSPWKPTRKS